jgi:hypothetical protein
MEMNKVRVRHGAKLPPDTESEQATDVHTTFRQGIIPGP